VIGKLGILEYIMVTPSHHRVHHASNEPYLDKNFGDMFIIWDKLFGTFAEEKEEPVYGLTKQLDSYSFLWQHFHFLVEIWYSAQQQKGIAAKLKVIFGSPADFDPAVRRIVEKRFLSKNKVRVRFPEIQTVCAGPVYHNGHHTVLSPAFRTSGRNVPPNNGRTGNLRDAHQLRGHYGAAALGVLPRIRTGRFDLHHGLPLFPASHVAVPDLGGSHRWRIVFLYFTKAIPSNDLRQAGIVLCWIFV
jgi:hypothetical protein